MFVCIAKEYRKDTKWGNTSLKIAGNSLKHGKGSAFCRYHTLDRKQSD